MCSKEGARHPERAWDVDPGSKHAVEVDSAGPYNPPAITRCGGCFVGRMVDVRVDAETFASAAKWHNHSQVGLTAEEEV